MEVIGKEHANRIYNISHLSIISIYYAMSLGLYDMMIVPSSVLVTSLNYWRNPIKGLRRNIDICTVQIGLFYNLLRSFESSTRLYYWISLIIGIVCFLKSELLKEYECISMYWHCCVHISANIGNMILYSGFN